MSKFLNKAGNDLDLLRTQLQRKGSTINSSTAPLLSASSSSSASFSSFSFSTTANTSAARKRPSPPPPASLDCTDARLRAAAAARLRDTDSDKLGTFDGVFIPTILSIWGILLFLRFGYILGQAGFLATLTMFSIGYLITSTTTLSLSAISTNGTVRGGGPYYMISRTLGPEFGGSIGLIFCLGNVLSGAMSVLGFVETVLSNLGETQGSVAKLLPESREWVIVYSSLILLFCSVVCLVGTRFFTRATMLLASILLISTLSIMFSLGLRQPFENEHLKVKFRGWNLDTLRANMWPELVDEVDLKQLFAIVFPACTGILTGASMSGDLKNPSRSIPSGTLGAVGFTYIAYAVMAVLMAGSLDRSTLKIDLSVMQDVAYIPSLVTIGILATSLFCTLGSIIGAAKILQAIAKDQLVKSLNRFSYGRVSDDGPTPAILLTWLIMQVLVAAVKDIDEMASYATMFSLLTFGVMNLACFLLRITGAVNFRPSFHYFTWQTASAGMIMCFVCMFYVDQLSASLSTLIMAAIFVLIHYKAPPKSWGDVMQSLIYHQVRKYLLRLDSRKDHVKFWRPQILILIDSPQENYLLIKFMNDLKKGGLYVLGHVLKGDFTHKIKEYKRQMPGWLRFVDIGRIKAFVELTIAKNERIGAQNLMLGGGLGGMKPNIVVMGFFDVSKQKASYDSEDDEGVETTSRARHRHQFTSSSSSSSTSCSGFDGDDNGNGARISTSTWARSAQPQAAPLTSPPHLNPQYRLRNPFTKRKISGIMEADTAAVLQKVSRDPLCSDLPRPSDVEKGISVENYVGIIEDALNLNKAVAISRNFEILDQKPSSTYSTCTSDGGNSRRSSAVRRWTTLVREEYRRVSYFFNDSLSQAAGRRAKQNLSAASPLLGGYHINHQEEYDIPESASCVAVALPLKKRFIDLWPIQMASIATGSSTYKYSFDTYTMVLQLGCTLHMQDYWKENYCLRVIAFVEDFEDAKDEEERVKTLLKGLRIEAEVKMVWLRSADGSVKSDSEEYEAHMVSAKKQQRGQYLKENMVSSSSSAAASSSSTFARFELPPMSPPLNASVPSVPRKMRRNTLSMMTTTRLPSSFLRRVESATPISPIHSPHGSPITSDDEEDGFLSPATSSLSARSPPLHLSTSPSSAYLSPPLIMYGALSTGNTALSSVLEERVTINMNSAAAGTSTSSSYSFASSSPSSPLPYSPSPVPPPFVPPPSLFNSLDTSSQHLILNQLMRKHSSSFTTALIFSTLPAPDPGTGLSREKSNVYVEQLDILSHDLQPIILVHGKGLTVTMSL